MDGTRNNGTRSNGKAILVIEDELDLARLVELHLVDAGYSVTLAPDGEEGLRRARAEPFDLVVLDLMLPGRDGLELCRELRRDSVYVPILMLTARSTELDRVLGLEVGADDYMTKPFSVRELVARVRAMFRRIETYAASDEASPVLQIGQFQIDTAKRRAQLERKDLPLTAKEFDLLAHFARHPGLVFSRAQLLDSVWGYGHDGYEHTVNSHINRLRLKIEPEPARPRFVLTVWGVGYKFFEGDAA